MEGADKDVVPMPVSCGVSLRLLDRPAWLAARTGGVDAGLNPRRRRPVGSELGEEGLGRKMAGDFATCSTAHAVADDKGTGNGGCGAGVLVVATYLTAIGKHCVNEFVGSHVRISDTEKTIHVTRAKAKAELVLGGMKGMGDGPEREPDPARWTT